MSLLSSCAVGGSRRAAVLMERAEERKNGNDQLLTESLEFLVVSFHTGVTRDLESAKVGLVEPVGESASTRTQAEKKSAFRFVHVQYIHQSNHPGDLQLTKGRTKSRRWSTGRGRGNHHQFSGGALPRRRRSGRLRSRNAGSRWVPCSRA